MTEPYYAFASAGPLKGKPIAHTSRRKDVEGGFYIFVPRVGPQAPWWLWVPKDAKK